MTRARRKWAPDENQRFVAMYSAGATYREISAALNIGMNTVAKKRAELGLPKRDLTLEASQALGSMGGKISRGVKL